MIPVLGEGGAGVRYVCVPCARAFIGGPGEAVTPAADPLAPADPLARSGVVGPDGLVPASGLPAAADGA